MDMPMYFSWNPDTVFLFKGWNLQSDPLYHAAAALLVFFLSFVDQFVEFLRIIGAEILRSKKEKCCETEGGPCRAVMQLNQLSKRGCCNPDPAGQFCCEQSKHKPSGCCETVAVVTEGEALQDNTNKSRRMHTCAKERCTQEFCPGKKRRCRPPRSSHVVKTLLKILRLTIHYVVMNATMTFSTWILFSAGLGAGLGYFCFAWKTEQKMAELVTKKRETLRQRQQQPGQSVSSRDPCCRAKSQLSVNEVLDTVF